MFYAQRFHEQLLEWIFEAYDTMKEAESHSEYPVLEFTRETPDNNTDDNESIQQLADSQGSENRLTEGQESGESDTGCEEADPL